MTLWEHLQELRRRFLWSAAAFAACFVLALVFYPYLIGFLTERFAGLENRTGQSLFIHGVAEGFLVQLRTAALAGLVASLPVHAVNLTQFIFPALGPRMRRMLTLCLLASFLLAALGAWIAFFQIIPFSIRFLTDSAFVPASVGLMLSFGQSVDYVLAVFFWTVVAFQAPLVLEILLMLKLLDRRRVFKASRFVVVGIFALAGILTPSVDPVSQCALAVPLVVLYFLVLLIARIFRFGERA